MSKEKEEKKEKVAETPEQKIAKLEQEITEKFFAEYQALVKKYKRDFEPTATIRIIKK